MDLKNANVSILFFKYKYVFDVFFFFFFTAAPFLFNSSFQG